MRQIKRRCPVCGKPLTEREYGRALGIHEAHQKELEEWKARARTMEKKMPALLQQARREGRKSERNQHKAENERLHREVAKWKEKARQRARGTTPQSEGLEFEERLADRLKREFAGDDVQHKGKGGDVLQIVKAGGTFVGRIIYECKRTPGIPLAHIRQALRAKQERNAAFAVLVTTGRRQRFSGFSQMNGVLVVSPLAALHAASLLRMHLIEMWQAGITKRKRQQIADRLLEHITRQEFRGPIEDAVRRAETLEHDLLDEAKDHVERWKRRWHHYEVIHWDISHVQGNLALIQRGQEPKAIGKPVAAPLALPPASA